jgi:hypothetical protein
MRREIAAFVMTCSLVSVFGVACTSPPPPEPGPARFGIATPSGLQEVEGRDRRRIFLRPGVRMSDYSEVLVDPFMVSYANPGGSTEGSVRTLDRKTEERFTDTLREAFVDEMKRSREFELVEQPGPEAIRVQGWVYDLVVEEPPRDDPRNFPLCFAEMTMVLTVRHAETAQALARVADRVRLSCAAERRALFHTADWKDVRAALRPWGAFLRHWLQDLRELPPVAERTASWHGTTAGQGQDALPDH